ncbi:MAG: phosphoribosylaminoimidazolesuccinocarboxamide synthase [Pseudomonadota bacterium]
MTDDSTLFESTIPELELLARGKVRDIYAVDADHLLMVTCDRISAFDVVMPTPIPDKGAILNQISLFWFARTADIVPNHLTERRVEDLLSQHPDRDAIAARSVVVQRLKPLPFEAIVRGYLAGSGWKAYQERGTLCDIALPGGLTQAERLPAPIFTPSSKAAEGHDENISRARLVALIGPALTDRVEALSLALYERAAAHAAQRGIIIADTKFEFGVDGDGNVVLMDEVLTPESSRFWPADRYATGISPPSFDKQFLRDWLETLDWNKTPPGPALPADIARRTRERYLTALDLLTDGTVGIEAP